MRRAVLWGGLTMTFLTSDALAQTDASAAADVAALAWMGGCWSTGTAEEQWMAPAGGLMVGMSRTVRDGRARGYEFLLMRVVDGRVVYWAYPSGQSPTSFPATEVGADQVVFENAEHDFPQKIRYRRESSDRMVASVFGAVTDESPAFELDYRRVACAGVIPG